MRRNIAIDKLAVPYPSGTRDGRKLASWVGRAFAVGTPVVFTGHGHTDTFAAYPHVKPIPPPCGTRGVVEQSGAYWTVVRVTDARDAAGPLRGLVGEEIDVANGKIHEALEPLVDNFVAQQPSLRMRPNPMPSIPSPYSRHWLDFYRRTFPPGMEIEFLERSGAPMNPRVFGRVVGMRVPAVSQAELVVEIPTKHSAVSVPLPLRTVYPEVVELATMIRPLVDTWATHNVYGLGLRGKPVRPNGRRTSRSGRRTSRKKGRMRG